MFTNKTTNKSCYFHIEFIYPSDAAALIDTLSIKTLKYLLLLKD